MISACRLVDFKMTIAKLTLFVEADGHDALDRTPLVRIYSDQEEPENWIAPVRNSDGGFDLRARPRWHNWQLRPRIRFDADRFSLTDVTNLIARVGMQVGIGEGRPDSKRSAGLGMGHFEIASSEETKVAQHEPVRVS